MRQDDVCSDDEMTGMNRYLLEFVLYIQDATIDLIKDSISEFGEDLEVMECPDGIAKGKNFRIRIATQDPTLVFDTCAQFGRIKSVKVNEEKGG